LNSINSDIHIIATKSISSNVKQLATGCETRAFTDAFNLWMCAHSPAIISSKVAMLGCWHVDCIAGVEQKAGLSVFSWCLVSHNRIDAVDVPACESLILTHSV
jgi:hypothetical protein